MRRPFLLQSSQRQPDHDATLIDHNARLTEGREALVRAA
jgi:hypothetical protein